jgi:hypothetical protein
MELEDVSIFQRMRALNHLSIKPDGALGSMRAPDFCILKGMHELPVHGARGIQDCAPMLQDKWRTGEVRHLSRYFCVDADDMQFFKYPMPQR